MHLFLQHVNFSQPVESLANQLEKLFKRKILSEAQKSAINLDDVKWLMSSHLGISLQKAKSVFRELPLNFPHIGQVAADPLDRTMLRGRIDLLLPDEMGFTLVDYKTDDVRSPNALKNRADFYRPQLQMYSQAIERITAKPVHTSHLVFLSARQIVTVRSSPPAHTILPNGA